MNLRPACVALLLALLAAAPVAAATHYAYNGGAIGSYHFSYGINGKCAAPMIVKVTHPTEFGAWRIEMTHLTGYDPTKTFGFQQLECLLPTFYKWEDVQGHPSTGWYRDTTTGCEREILSLGATGRVGLVTFFLSRAGCGTSMQWTANLVGV